MLTIAALFAITLALPVEAWRRGEPAGPPLEVTVANDNERLTVVRGAAEPAQSAAKGLATLLRNHPDLRGNVMRIVAVIGRRKGHLFHPVEG